MHIAYLTPEYPHPSFPKSGGLGTSIQNLAKSLVDLGHTVSIIVPYQKEEIVIQHLGINIYAIAKKKYLFANWLFYKKHIQKKLASLHKKYNFDVIEGPDWTGLGTFVKLPAPYIVRLHGSDSYFCRLENRKQKKKNFFLEKKNLLKANAIVSASTYTAEKTKEIFKIKKPITTIYNGIDTGCFKPVNVSVNNDEVLYFGAIIRKKGVLDLAHSFNLLVRDRPGSRLTFVGRDVIDVLENRSTVDLIKNILTLEAIQKVRFVTEVPYQEVIQYLSKAAVICLPSYAEAYPMTWLEAMSMEKALVTSNIGWAKEMMIHNETGFMVHPSEHKEMVQYLKQLLDEPDVAKSLGINARKRVIECFSTNIIAEQNINFYYTILKS